MHRPAVAIEPFGVRICAMPSAIDAAYACRAEPRHAKARKIKLPAIPDALLEVARVQRACIEKGLPKFRAHFIAGLTDRRADNDLRRALSVSGERMQRFWGFRAGLVYPVWRQCHR